MHPASARSVHDRAYGLHRAGLLAEAEPLYRDAIALDPGFAAAWRNLGLAALALGRAEEAAACARQALRIDPESSDAWNGLGMVHYAQGHVAEAGNCFLAALRGDPGHANAALNLGATRLLSHRAAEAEALFRRSLALGGDAARACSNLALALMEQARSAEAEAACRAALAAAPGNAEARINLALALLAQGKWAEGWQAYEARWQTAAALPGPRWTGQALNGETVALLAEQGFGDTLQFCRYAPMVAAMGGRVVLVVPRALQRLMLSLPGVAEVLAEEDNALPPFDCQCPLLSLPLAFATTVTSVPACPAYLSADPAPWSDFLRDLPGLKVGIVWAGRSRGEQPHAAAIDQRRSMRLAALAPLFGVPGCSFVSLQLGPAAAQSQHVPTVRDVSARLGDWDDTAGLVAGLDLVIAVDTAVAHLAGALGRPVWLLSRFDACWRWLEGREDTPWYPTMRIFRKGSPGDWAEVVERVRAALTALAERESSRRLALPGGTMPELRQVERRRPGDE
jgi:tetratricopeptide (TPR) repeat protein